MKIGEKIKDELQQIEDSGLLRRLAPPKGVDLASNDYLGLAGDERLKAALIEGLTREGIGSTGSRLLRGERDCFSDAEERFAVWKGSESSLYFATGYQANVGVMQTFLKRGDVVFSDELNHASLIDGIRLSKCNKAIFRHCDIDDLKQSLEKTNCSGQKFLVTESLFSMDGDIAPLREYAGICRETNTNLIVDEAHSVGLYGLRGSGLIEEFGIEKDVFLSINPMGKALGVSGAFVSGDRNTIRYLINKCRSFVFSTAPIPAIADVLVAAVDIVEHGKDLRKELRAICDLFNRKLVEFGLDAPKEATQIVPVVIGDSKEAMWIASRMQDAGYDVRAIRPPTVAEGTSRLRISLNVMLTNEVLSDFVDKLCEELKSAQQDQDSAEKCTGE
ncbi:MAG: 8-amino-7-oxononanoate synthase [Pyrinomonadaceae bacterium]